jgi:hypothetical protein
MIEIEKPISRVKEHVFGTVNLPVSAYGLEYALSRVENFRPSNPEYWDIEGDLEKLKVSVSESTYDVRYDAIKEQLLSAIEKRLNQEKTRELVEEILKILSAQDTKYAIDIEYALETGGSIEFQRKISQWEQEEKPLKEQLDELNMILSRIKQSN